MAQAQGTVEKIVQKPTRNGGTAYSFVIDGTWYGHGFDAPKFGEGDTISFDYQQNGNFKNVNAKSVQKVQAPAAQEPAQGAAPARNYGSNQVAIQYQASRNAAIEAVGLALQADALPLPAKKGDKFDALLALISDVTVQFHAATDKVVADGGVYPEELEQQLASHDSFE